MEVSKSELIQVNDASPEDIYRKLQAYEDTGLTPEEIKKLQEVNVLLQKQNDLAHKTILSIEKEINQ